MSSDLFRFEENLFVGALALAPEDRLPFLRHACGPNTELRERVEALLRSHELSDGIFEVKPVPGVAEVASVLHREAPPDAESDCIGRYHLLRKIGEGGFGIVWLAEQREPVRRHVALKIIRAGMDTREVVLRFELERQALAMMDHPNIARVFDGGATASGRPYFVMELVSGIPITRYCDDHRLGTAARLDLFLKVCRAVQHAHQKGIIHRDLKPSNILVAEQDGAAVPKVIDFGIAKATAQQITNVAVMTVQAQIMGTPAYMSPEQLEFGRSDVDTRSDIYNLGVLLYELLAGRQPFNPASLARGDVEQIRHQIREVEPPRPSVRFRMLPDEDRNTIAHLRNTTPAHLATNVRGDLDWIVMRCIEKDRTRRYDTANGLAMDLQRHLQNEPVVARPPTRTYVLRKLVRRHRVAFLSASVVMATLALGVAVSTWAFLREKAAHARAAAAEVEEKTQRQHALSAQASEAELRRTAERNELAARRRAYAADINLVQQALAVDHVARAGKLLDRQRPQAGEADLRGWEWRYLWQLCQSNAQATICDNQGRIGSLGVSSDGRWFAVGNIEKGRLSVFDRQSGEEIVVPAGDTYVWVAFSPTEPVIAVSATADGRTAKPTHRVFLWNVVTRQEVLTLPLRQFCGRLAFSADGEKLATASTELAVWRVRDGTKLSGVRLPPNGIPPSIHIGAAFAADCSLAACVVEGNRICVMDLKTGAIRWQAVATTAPERINALAFSPDNRLLATAAAFQDSTIRLWDVATGNELGRLEGHRTYAQTLMFLPDGKTLASGGADQTVRLWNVETRQLLRTLRGHKSGIRAIAALPGTRTFASGATDGTVFIWDAATTEINRAHIVLPKSTVAWRVHPDNATLITVDRAGAVEAWSGRAFQASTVLMDVGPCADAFFSNDGSALVTTSTSGVTRIWDWSWQRPVSEWTNRRLQPIALLAGGQKLIAAGGPPYFSQIGEWQVDTGERVKSWDVPYFQGDRALAASPDERWIVAGSLDTGFVLIDREQGSIVLRSEQASRGPAFSPDSRLLAIPVPANGRTYLWDVQAGREITYVDGFLQGSHSAAFSPDGSRLAVSSSGREAIKIWDMASLENLLTLDARGSTSRTNTAFSPSGDIIGAYFDAQILNLWRAPTWAEIAAAERAAAAAKETSARRTAAMR